MDQQEFTGPYINTFSINIISDPAETGVPGSPDERLFTRFEITRQPSSSSPDSQVARTRLALLDGGLVGIGNLEIIVDGTDLIPLRREKIRKTYGAEGFTPPSWAPTITGMVQESLTAQYNQAGIPTNLTTPPTIIFAPLPEPKVGESEVTFDEKFDIFSHTAKLTVTGEDPPARAALIYNAGEELAHGAGMRYIRAKPDTGALTLFHGFGSVPILPIPDETTAAKHSAGSCLEEIAAACSRDRIMDDLIMSGKADHIMAGDVLSQDDRRILLLYASTTSITAKLCGDLANVICSRRTVTHPSDNPYDWLLQARNHPDLVPDFIGELREMFSPPIAETLYTTRVDKESYPRLLATYYDMAGYVE